MPSEACATHTLCQGAPARVLCIHVSHAGTVHVLPGGAWAPCCVRHVNSFAPLTHTGGECHREPGHLLLQLPLCPPSGQPQVEIVLAQGWGGWGFVKPAGQKKGKDLRA